MTSRLIPSLGFIRKPPFRRLHFRVHVMDLCSNDVCTDSVGSRSGSYQRYDKRLSSFDKWPIQMKQSREDMAAAGFVYSNCGDRVYCFSCVTSKWGNGTRLTIPGRNTRNGLPVVFTSKWWAFLLRPRRQRGTAFTRGTDLGPNPQPLLVEDFSRRKERSHGMTINGGRARMTRHSFRNYREGNIR